MKYEKVIFGGKVLNNERHLTYFQFSIYRKTMESTLKDLNSTFVTKLTQKQANFFEWMENCFLCQLQRFFLYNI